ncbi:ArsR family transcriptional regulator [Mycolicibacterium sp. NCC-Tsukiji]|uniref:arsenate reductase/protein-tyrosine-phosphatase family protein n=1 Tax=Mycolicibacterium sp. NCC-Tsukiji TaxID=2185272 RepID=UPI0035B53666
MNIESMSMEPSDTVHRRAAIHAALADPGRLTIVDHLLLADASPSELQELLSVGSNLLAHHLRVLAEAGLITRRRSEADGRRTYLHLDRRALDAMVPAAARRARRVVFVCTQNSARSQLAAAIWNRMSAVPATSAGTHPAEHIHPLTLAAAQRRQLPMPARTPQRLDDVLQPSDLVIAVCDNAHEEMPADPQRIHWSIPDPVRAATPDAFDIVIDTLVERIDHVAPRLRAG